MNILVYDIAAQTGGAVTILKEFYEKYKQDTANQYYFVTSVIDLPQCSHVRVLKFPKVKKSWLHRLAFDYFTAPKLVRKLKIDKVISLQNVMIPRLKIPQTVYEHNVLPFADCRFSLRSAPKLWVYQNIIGRQMVASIKKADEVIVQTAWMKEKLSAFTDGSKVKIMFPKVEVPCHVRYQPEQAMTTFFYPANAAIFKNHKVILDACLALHAQGERNFRVVFTLEESTCGLAQTVMEHQLPVVFAGRLNKEEMLAYYARSVLVFPSYLETVGLPLVEAKACGCPILAADCAYAKEALNGYGQVQFFDYQDANALSALMLEQLKNIVRTTQGSKGGANHGKLK